jgi:hypothetical protein
VDGETRCGPHGGETSKTKSWTIEPVHGGGRVKRLGGRRGRARGVWWFAHKTIGGRFLGLGLKTKSKDPTRRRRDPGVSGSFEAEDTRRGRMACVDRTRGAVKAWPSDGKTHKHYINASAWVVSPVVVRGSRVISHTGGARYISHECVWMSPSLHDLGFHFPLLFLFFCNYFLLHFL